jgi:hypothetical protein
MKYRLAQLLINGNPASGQPKVVLSRIDQPEVSTALRNRSFGI